MPIFIIATTFLVTGVGLGWWLAAHGNAPEGASPGRVSATLSHDQAPPSTGNRDQSGEIDDTIANAGAAEDVALEDVTVEDAELKRVRDELLQEIVAEGLISGDPRDVRGEILSVKSRESGPTSQLVLVQARVENATDHYVSLMANVEVAFRFPGRDSWYDRDNRRYDDLRPVRFQLIGRESSVLHFAVMVPVALKKKDRGFSRDEGIYQPEEDLHEIADVLLYAYDGRGNARQMQRAKAGKWPIYVSPGKAEYQRGDTSFDDMLDGRTSFAARFSLPKLQRVLGAVAGVRKIPVEHLQVAEEYDGLLGHDKYIYDIALLYAVDAEEEPVSFHVTAQHTFAAHGVLETGHREDWEGVTLNPGELKHVMLIVNMPRRATAKFLGLYVSKNPIFGHLDAPLFVNDPTRIRLWHGRVKK